MPGQRLQFGFELRALRIGHGRRVVDLPRQGQPLTIAGDGSHTRDYVHVSDVVRANILATMSDKVGKGEVINVGSGEETSLKVLAELIGGPTEAVAPRIETARSVADVSRAKELLGWSAATKLENGIAELKRIYGL